MDSWHRKTLYHDEEWAKVLRRDPCVYCGLIPSGTVEHVDPRGTRSTVNNGVGACRACNGERGSVPLIFYLVWRATDRSESFNRWNFSRFADRIRTRQLRRKANRLEGKDPLPEERARTLVVSLGERLGREASSVTSDDK